MIPFIAAAVAPFTGKLVRYLIGGGAILLVMWGVYSYVDSTGKRIQELSAKNVVLEVQLKQSEENFVEIKKNFDLQTEIIKKLYVDLQDDDSVKTNLDRVLSGLDLGGKNASEALALVDQLEREMRECAESATSGKKPSVENRICK